MVRGFTMKWSNSVVTGVVQVVLSLLFVYGCCIALGRYFEGETAPTLSYETYDEAPSPSYMFLLLPKNESNWTFADLDFASNVRSFFIKVGVAWLHNVVDLTNESMVASHGWDYHSIWDGGIRLWEEQMAANYFIINPPKLNCTGIDCQVFFHVNVSQQSMLTVTVHNKDEVIPAFDSVSGSASIYRKIEDAALNQTTYSLVTYTRRKETHVHPDRPCRPSGLPGFHSSLVQYVSGQLGCQPIFTGLSDDKKDICPDNSNHTMALKRAIHTLRHMNLDQTRAMIKSMEPCSFYQHSLKTIYETTNDGPNAKGGQMTFAFITEQRSIPIETFKKVYTLSHLVADIGGYMGLLLGASLLSFYKQAVKFLDSKRLCYWQQK